MELSIDSPTLRLGVFLIVLVAMSTLEAIFPRKHRRETRRKRWATNLGFAVINTVALRLVVPLAAAGTALWAGENGVGLFNIITTPDIVSLLITMMLLDVALYWQHVATHKIPFFWRFHKVHHADRDLDASSGVRFHPFEICASMVYKMGLVALLGAPLLAVIIFEIVLNACALFNHANLRLPIWLDRTLRIFIVTPDYHRVHHSSVEAETNSNYGFSLTLWDHLFGSYKAQPDAGHDGITIGLSEYQDDNPQKLGWSLAIPFK